MNNGSLRLRLLAASTVSILLALLLAGLLLMKIFEAQVSDRVKLELSNHLLQLAGALETGSDGRLYLARQLADPRFQEPLSGLYWQIVWDEQKPLRSRSLWDDSLIVPKSLVLGTSRLQEISGPGGAPLIVLDRTVSILKQNQPYEVRLLVGIDASEVNAPVASFRQWMLLSLSALAIFLGAASWAQVKIGLRPLDTLRGGLVRIRSGTSSRLSGYYPKEIAPLVDELNSLLDVQDKNLVRARSRAADLAHGLKTPLTVLSAIARDLEDKGGQKAAADISEQADVMHVVIKRELSKARLAQGQGNAKVALAKEVESLLAAMRRMPRSEQVEWISDVPADISAPLEQADLVELLGNILDNARKWAHSKIRVSVLECVKPLTLLIEDDGPGVNSSDVSKIMERGFSLDGNAQGTGLGLAIVKDIADLYRLQVGFARSSLGGLAVIIKFPTA